MLVRARPSHKSYKRHALSGSSLQQDSLAKLFKKINLLIVSQLFFGVEDYLYLSSETKRTKVAIEFVVHDVKNECGWFLTPAVNNQVMFLSSHEK